MSKMIKVIFFRKSCPFCLIKMGYYKIVKIMKPLILLIYYLVITFLNNEYFLDKLKIYLKLKIFI